MVYLAQAPLLTWIKQPVIKDVWPSFSFYLISGMMFIVPYLVMYPELLITGLFIMPFFLLNIRFAKLKKERLLINDACAIAGLSGLGYFAWQIGGEAVDVTAFSIVLFHFLFFLGSVFHVKGLIREKRNVRFKQVGKGYHTLLVLFFYVFASWSLFVVGLMTLLKTMLLNEEVLDRPVKIGVVEILNSVVFFVGAIVHFWG